MYSMPAVAAVAAYPYYRYLRHSTTCANHSAKPRFELVWIPVQLVRTKFRVANPRLGVGGVWIEAERQDVVPLGAAAIGAVVGSTITGGPLAVFLGAILGAGWGLYLVERV